MAAPGPVAAPPAGDVRAAANEPAPPLSRGWRLALLLVALPLWVRVVEPHGRDQQLFAVLGRELWRGALPYRDLFEHKPPGVLAAWALTHLLDGGAGWAAGALDVAAALAAAAMLAAALMSPVPGRRVLGPLAALLYLLGARAEVFGGWWTRLQPEVLQDVAVAAALLAGRRGRWALAGAAVFAALALKFTYVGLWPLVALWAHGAAGRRGLLRLHLGLLAPALALAAMAFAAGALGPMVDAVLRFNLRHAGVGGLSPAAAAAMAWIALQELALALPWIILGGVAELPLALRGGRVSAPPADPAAAGELPRWLLPGLLGAALLQVAIQGKLWQLHWLPVVLPLAALAAQAALRLLAAARRRPGGGQAATLAIWASLALAAAPALAMSAPAWWRQLAPGGRADVLGRYVNPPSRFSALEVAAVGLRLRQLAGPDDALLVFGFEPGIYLTSTLRPGSRWLYDYPLMVALPAEERAAAVATLAAQLPAIAWVAVYDDDRNPLERQASSDQLRATPALWEALRASHAPVERLGRVELWRRR